MITVNGLNGLNGSHPFNHVIEQKSNYKSNPLGNLKMNEAIRRYIEYGSTSENDLFDIYINIKKSGIKPTFTNSIISQNEKNELNKKYNSTLKSINSTINNFLEQPDNSSKKTLKQIYNKKFGNSINISANRLNAQYKLINKAIKTY